MEDLDSLLTNAKPFDENINLWPTHKYVLEQRIQFNDQLHTCDISVEVEEPLEYPELGLTLGLSVLKSNTPVKAIDINFTPLAVRRFYFHIYTDGRMHTWNQKVAFKIKVGEDRF